MSNKLFDMSEDHMGNMTGPLSYGGLPLAVSSGYQSSSTPSSETTTPCSSTSPSNLGDLDGNSSPDVHVLACSVMEDSHPKLNRLSKVRMNLHQTSFTTPVNDRVNVWNQTLSLMSSPEMASLEGNNLYKNSGDSGDNPRVVTSPESTEGPSPLESCEASRRCSSENNCCSLSSGELVMRSNSLEDETLPLFSSQEESFMSPAVNSGVFISEAHYASPHLPDDCEGLQDKKSMESTNPAYFDRTKWHLTEYEKLNTLNLHVTLPIETEFDFLSTFLHDPSNSDADQMAPPSAQASAEAGKPSNLNATFVQIHDNTFVDPIPEVEDSAADTQTSTPVLHIGNHFSLLSFSGSSFSGSTDSPTFCPPQELQIPQTLKQQLDARLSSISDKAVKTDIKTFPKPDYSGVKSRIMTRLSHQLATPGTTPAKSMLHKSSKMTGCATPSQVNWKAVNKIATAKLTHKTAAISPTTASIGVPKEKHAVKGDMRKMFIQSDGEDMSAANPSQPGPLSISEDAEGVSRGSLRNSLGTGNEDASSALGAELSPYSEQAASGQEVTSLLTQQPFNATFCTSSLLETPDQNDDPKPSTEVSHRNGVGSGSASCCDTRPLAIMRSVDSSTSQTRPSKEKRSSSPLFNLSSTTRPSVHPGQPKSRNLSNKQDDEAGVQMGTPEESTREFRKIRLVAESPKSKVAEASGSTCDQSKSRLGGRPSPRQSKVLLAPRTTGLSPGTRPVPLSSRQRQQGTSGAFQRATDLLQLKQRNIAAHPKALATDKPTMGAPTARTKPAVNGFRPLQSSSRSSPAGPSHAPVSKVPQKAPGPSRSTVLKAGNQSGSSRNTGSIPVAPLRPSSFKTVVLKTRVLAKPLGDHGPTLATSCKSASSSKPGLARSIVIPLRRTVSSRISQLASSLPAEKSKPKAGSRQQQQPQQRVPHTGQSVGGRVPVPTAVGEDEPSKRKDPILQKLRELLAAGNHKFEAMAVVLQRTLAERDEAVSRRRELSQELVNLQAELVCSATSCERLEKEKEEVRASVADALRRLEEQHNDELAQLEVRLQAFYQAEWDKVHRTYQEEADKCRTLMEQQIGDLKATHEATKLDLKADHDEHLQDVKRQYEDSLEELRKAQSEELQSLQKTLKEAEATLSGQIQELMEENNTLVQNLKAEEERRKQLAGKSQKDSHTLYLEQELESLKVVLDIKNKQLHQQEKKLLQMDTVVDKSVKLDESLKKVQQENEDLKARMDRHAALSRQLSTEQAVLHQSLQKESKVNKRLSMENEELLWKLHNGELGSPRMVSPTSPSHTNSFQSPRSSALFSSPPLSPR